MSASAGRVLIIPKGDYNSAITYNMLDMVYYGGKSYICKQTSTGNLPTNNVYWQIMLDGASALNDLTDVNITDPQNGDGIAYNATAHKWENTTPVGITIASPPATTDYSDGDILDLTGMVVMAEYSTGQTRNITGECTFTPANGATLTPANTSVTVIWRTFTATQAITVTAIYGVEWDGSSSPALTRTDASVGMVDPVPQMINGTMWTTGSSPFDNIMPWSGMERVTDANAGTLVKIPKFYYKLEINDSTGALKLQICSKQITGFSVSPAHMDRGDGQGERDFVYVGAYHCSSNDFKSTSGVACATNINRSDFRDGIHSLGSDIWQWDKAMLTTIQMLYLVEFAHWNSQGKIGRGCSDSGSVQNTGLCDAMTYHTGTNTVNLYTYGHTRYRYIEDLWGNVYDWIDGVYVSSGKAYFIKNPADFSDSIGGTYDGFSNSLIGINEIKKFKKSSVTGFEWVVYPSETGYSMYYDDYICDVGTSSAGGVVVGGAWSQTDRSGLFYQQTNSSRDSSIGSRLMVLPANS